MKSGTGAYLGSVMEKHLEKAMIKPGSSVVAEIYKPIYNGQTLTTLYIPMSSEAIEHIKMLDGLKLWVNVGADKWSAQPTERLDSENVEVIASQHDGKKETFVILADGIKLFEVNSRMKMYQDMVERAQYKPRRLIAEQKQGEYGDYYHVGFYY